jgi:hypothetical protein
MKPEKETQATLEYAIAKKKVITFRLSAADKDSMKAVAEHCHMSVSEYLVKLHHYAKDRIDPNK